MYTAAVRQTHDGQTEMDRQIHDRADRGRQTDTRRIEVDRHTSNRGRQTHRENTEVDTQTHLEQRQTDTREKAEVDTQTHDGQTDRQTELTWLVCHMISASEWSK